MNREIGRMGRRGGEGLKGKNEVTKEKRKLLHEAIQTEGKLKKRKFTSLHEDKR